MDAIMMQIGLPEAVISIICFGLGIGLTAMVFQMITRAKVDTVHNRRTIAKKLSEKAVLNKLFKDIAPRFQKRQGGYTRILKLGRRVGDAAEMVLLELVERKEKEKKPKKKKQPGSTKAGT